MTQNPAIGIDLGGTKVHAGVVSPRGEVLGQARLPTEARREPEAILDNIARAVHSAIEESALAADEPGDVGLGSPGPLDMREGVLLTPGNLPTLHGFPIVERLSAALGRRVVLNNDANCFGLAEARFGAGQGEQVCCGLTLGTGLGGFLVVDGHLYNGPRGAGVEIWCSPYRGDHVEEKVSGRGVARNYAKLTERRADAKDIAAKARQGDGAAREAWREFGRDLAVPVAYLCNVADPDVCVLGGSMSRAWDLFQ
ncbi:MAG: ROK family protein, partial [Candidatus Brocadiia bacterium]